MSTPTRRFLGRLSRATVPVAKPTVDGTPREWELARAVYRAEMLLNRALIAVDGMLPYATDPQHVVDLITLEDILTGRTK